MSQVPNKHCFLEKRLGVDEIVGLGGLLVDDIYFDWLSHDSLPQLEVLLPERGRKDDTSHGEMRSQYPRE